MPIKKGVDRNQLQLLSLEQVIHKKSFVRTIDAFINRINPIDLKFKIKGKSHEGKPAYSAKVLIGIYLYGYIHSVRSSRGLEKECKSNVELWWLINGLRPCYKTIADFRKDNAIGFENLFKYFSYFILERDLYGKTTVAIDGTKIRAQNSKKNNYNEKKLIRHLEYLERKEEDYLDLLDKNDTLDSSVQEKIEDELLAISKRKEQYNQLRAELEISGALQISTIDADARALPVRMNIVEVGYNVQSTVDDKHNLILDYQVTNKKDTHALHEMSMRAKEALLLKEQESLTVLADRGYATAEEIHKCQLDNIDTLVAPKQGHNEGRCEGYGLSHFQYDITKDEYICPAGKSLKATGKIYSYRRKEIKKYTISFRECNQCPYFERCLSKGAQKNSIGKGIERSIYQDAVDKNRNEVKSRKEEYRKRQAIVEPARLKHSGRHPFGTIKRQWGYNYTLMKGIEKVNGEFAIIFLCYNLRRMMTILGEKGLEKALKAFKKGIRYLTSIIEAHNMIKETKLEINYIERNNLRIAV